MWYACEPPTLYIMPGVGPGTSIWVQNAFMTEVPRIGRYLDAAGALLFASGCAVYLRAWFGFREVQSFERSPGDPVMAAVEMADRFWFLEKVGIGLAVAGLGVFVLAWWVARSVNGQG